MAATTWTLDVDEHGELTITIDTDDVDVVRNVERAARQTGFTLTKLPRCPDCRHPWNVKRDTACPGCGLQLEALDDADAFLHQLDAEADVEREEVEL